MVNTFYDGTPIDMFMAGDSVRSKQIAQEFALAAGFGACHDMGAMTVFP
jgi:hypothetical protein